MSNNKWYVIQAKDGTEMGDRLNNFYKDYDKIAVPIMYYTDDDGKKVFDKNEMYLEFEAKLQELEERENEI